MQVGRITFGPVPVETRTADAACTYKQVKHAGLTADLTQAHMCNCIGPQVGQTKCPCALRAESAQASRMVADGVVIDGIEYDLVPRRKRSA